MEIEIDRHMAEVADLLNTKCPGCNRVFYDFDGCFAVTHSRPDGCGQLIFGWCFETFDDSATSHAHVVVCENSVNRGHYFGNIDDFLRLCSERNNRRANAYIDTIESEDIKERVRERARPLMEEQ